MRPETGRSSSVGIRAASEVKRAPSAEAWMVSMAYHMNSLVKNGGAIDGGGGGGEVE